MNFRAFAFLLLSPLRLAAKASTLQKSNAMSSTLPKKMRNFMSSDSAWVIAHGG